MTNDTDDLNLKKIAEDARTYVRRQHGLLKLVNAVDRIGDLRRARQEAENAIERAKAELAEYEKALDGFAAQCKEEEGRAVAIRHNADEVLKESKIKGAEADRDIENAKKQADAIIYDAKERAQAIIAEATDKLPPLQTEAAKRQQKLEEIENDIANAQEELAFTKQNIEQAKAKARKQFAAELG